MLLAGWWTIAPRARGCHVESWGVASLGCIQVSGEWGTFSLKPHASPPTIVLRVGPLYGRRRTAL